MNEAYLFNTGQNYKSYLMLGSRPGVSFEGEHGYRFAVWAPRALGVSVVGDFNHWSSDRNLLKPYGTTGIWVGFVVGATAWQRYKYAITTRSGRVEFKADPFARHSETRPNNASVLYDPDDYEWQDQEWMRKRLPAREVKPLNIYECHLGSWRRYPDGNTYSYREIAPQLAGYLKEMGYNAVELMPINEYPLDASWGYQVSGYFAITSRYGTPADFKYLVDTLHGEGIRVIVDWVPGHFPKDDFALARFDGEALYEHPDPRRGEHATWGTYIFNFGMAEVLSFLLSSACLLLDEFHVDGLRIDAVSSILSLNFGHSEHNRIKNIQGGDENLEGVAFIRKLNQVVEDNYPSVLMIAEESTAWPYVTKRVAEGGLGFTHKWDMGWMNDTLKYVQADYYARGQFQDQITFSMMYAFSERFVLPFSHDEVVHGKKSLLGRMPGDYWRQFASLRTLYMYQYAHPGANLNFMGNEFAPFTEWRYYEELEWFMLKYPAHAGMKRYVRDLNHLYLERTALWEDDYTWEGFKWLQVDDRENSVLAFRRRGKDRKDDLICILNMTPASFSSYRLDVEDDSGWRVVLNSDAPEYDGSGYWQERKVPGLFAPVEVPLVEGGREAATTGDAEIKNAESLTSDCVDKDQLPEIKEQEPRIKWQLDIPLPPLAGLILARDEN